MTDRTETAGSNSIEPNLVQQRVDATTEKLAALGVDITSGSTLISHKPHLNQLGGDDAVRSS
jgi:hypothetical protein